MSKLPDISNMRGMSDPTFFAFNVLEGDPRTVLAHGVILTSFLVADDCSLPLLAASEDPRMNHLVKFLFENLAKGLNEKLKAIAKDIEDRKAALHQLGQEIKQLRKELQK